MKSVIGVLVLVGIGAYVWLQLGGSISGTAPQREVPRPKLPDVDPNEAAGKAVSGADKAADTIAGLSPQAWSVIIIALTAAAFVKAWFSRPGFKWTILGIGMALLFFVMFVAPRS